MDILISTHVNFHPEPTTFDPGGDQWSVKKVTLNVISIEAIRASFSLEKSGGCDTFLWCCGGLSSLYTSDSESVSAFNG